MAIPTSVIAKLTATLTTKEGREKIGGIIGGGVLLVVLILCVFLMLVSGILGLFTGAAVRDNWTLVKNNVADVFSAIDRSASQDVKQQVYDYMPDFSVNLSKAAIATNYNAEELLMYDTADFQKAEENMTAVAEAVRLCKDEDEFKKVCQNYHLPSDFDWNIISSDTTFMLEPDLVGNGLYSDETLRLLKSAAVNVMGNYKYEYEEYTTSDGKEATKQTLTVTKDGETQIVEYHAVGGVELYLPELMAYYQVRLLNDILTNNADAETVDKAIEDGLGGDIAAAKNEEELNEAISNTSASSLLSFMQIADLKGILQKAVSNGTVGAYTTRTYGTDYTKLKIQLEAPSKDEWLKLFNVPDEMKQYIGTYQQGIVKMLTDNSISEDEMYLNLNDFFQEALFVYFEGFFNLPVDSTELVSGGNGILTKYGDFSTLHMLGQKEKVYEDGVTLALANANTEVKIDLLPSVSGRVFDDIVIYDVWQAENHEGQENNVLYGHDAITIAYYINLPEFEKEYGFPFPQADENEYSHDYVTVLVEYSCLDECYYTEDYIGTSIKDDVLNGRFSVGICHNGDAVASDHDTGVWKYRHYIDAPTPHCTIRMDLTDGWAESPAVYDDEIYNGIAGNIKNYRISPLMWFKGFRTELDDEIIKGLIAA